MLLPISFQFVAAGAAIQAKGALYKFHPSRTNEAPSWDGRGRELVKNDVATPITPISFWQGRYALCTLTFSDTQNANNKLVMNDAIIAISRSKNIVTTQMVGMDGTVKEYISMGDYNLNIVVGVVAVKDGVIVDEYPKDGLETLRGFFDMNRTLKVESEFLKIFDINQIVIKSFSVSQDTASNYQSVSLSAVSDEEYNVYSNEY